MPALNPVKDRLANGGAVVGTWMQTASPYVANAIAHSGLDFVTIDMEHGPQSLESAESMLYAIEAGGSHGMARLGKGGAEILRVCDIGCRSILVAHCQTAEEASSVVRAMLYAPDGDRGLAPFTRVHGYSAENLPERLRNANDHQLAGILIEDGDGLGNIADIVAVPRLDLVYLGIYDLSQTLGLAGQVDHPDVLAEVTRAVGIINSAGLAAGAVARDQAHMEWLLINGFRYISYLSDTALIAQSFRAVKSAYDQLSRITH